jgi:hypothetical protein
MNFGFRELIFYSNYNYRFYSTIPIHNSKKNLCIMVLATSSKVRDGLVQLL